jgi:mercuric ion transport protein
MKAQSATAFGSVVSGVLASVCCIGPLVFALLGISGAALARRFEPFRPYLLVLTYGLLGAAFYLAYRPVKAAVARARRVRCRGRTAPESWRCGSLRSSWF